MTITARAIPGRLCESPARRQIAPVRRVLVLGLLVLLTAGCSRPYYRHRADEEVYALVDCASTDPRWPLENFTVDPDPRSRMFDPNNPDCPPMPPDDPASHELMRYVDGKKGWPCWDAYGHTRYAENPEWKIYLSYDENGQVVLDRNAAMRMALLHSPNYQRELESLYLAALAVTLQRFQFDTQFFGRNSNNFTTDGPLSGRASSRSTHLTDTSFGFNRKLAAGGQVLTEVANSIVWQFSGPDSYDISTPLKFSLIQPLLRGAGRAVVLENLTSSERALLANIRGLERFHREFYVQTVAGAGAAVGGYLSLLEQQLQIRNQQANVAALRDSLERADAFLEAGRIDRIQVDQIGQSLYSSQINLLRRSNSYQNQLDAYKIQLGLPPQLEVKIDDPLLQPFNLIDPDLTAAREAVSRLSDHLREPGLVIVPSALAEEPVAVIQQGAALLDAVERDLRTLVAVLPARRASLRRLGAREEFTRKDIDPRLADVGALHRRVVEMAVDFYGKTHPYVEQLVGELLTTQADRQWFEGLTRVHVVANDLKATLAEVEEFRQELLRTKAELALEEADALRQRLIGLASELSDRLVQLSLIQASARLDAATLLPIELDADRAIEIARGNRRDWMNTRAELVDRWRQIEVAANDLQSDFGVSFRGDVTPRSEHNANPTVGTVNNATGQVEVGLQFDAPLTRLAERNDYRKALIAYQQARRDYYRFEDGVSRGLRDILRSIRLGQLQFELERAAVRLAIARVEQQQLRMQEPPKPGQERVSVGPTAARDLVDALDSLLGAQNSFLRAWLDYEVLRLNLDFDLGTMQLDADGLWLDPGPIESGSRAVPEGIDGSLNRLDQPAPGPVRRLPPVHYAGSPGLHPRRLPPADGARRGIDEVRRLPPGGSMAHP